MLEGRDIWEKGFKTKDEKIWKGWVECFHPTYLPFDLMTPRIYEALVEKYEDKSLERPDWMNKSNESEFIKRVARIYKWKGTDGEEVNKALAQLFERSGVDLEEGVDGQLSFIQSKKSTQKLKVIPE